ncbi:hypothetical protein ACUOAQ_28405, partial [Escherichia sp. SP-MK]
MPDEFVLRIVVRIDSLHLLLFLRDYKLVDVLSRMVDKQKEKIRELQQAYNRAKIDDYLVALILDLIAVIQ